jgi:hypothetical protein
LRIGQEKSGRIDDEAPMRTVYFTFLNLHKLGCSVSYHTSTTACLANQPWHRA